jgi:tetratricopeptide (TPR) repeat protein
MTDNSVADLGQLEYEFATQPNSEAFIPLARAYLQVGRFVEAMVVCKKGIRSHANLVEGRQVMAQIYAAQGKNQKAMEELEQLFSIQPDHIDAFRLMGALYLKVGQEKKGLEFFKRILDQNPADEEAREELVKRGVDYAPSNPELQTTASSLSERPTQEVKVVAKPMAPHSVQQGISQAISQPVRSRPAPRTQRKRVADIFQEMEARKKPTQGKGLKYTLLLGGSLMAVLSFYLLYTWQARLTQIEINTQLKQGGSFFGRDTYAGYRKSLESYRAIYKIDKEHAEGLARASFVCAVLLGEYAGGDAIYSEGETYLRQARALGQDSTMLQAAEALLAVYGGGNVNEVIKGLGKAMEKQPGSALLRTTMGRILLKKGDLSGAKEHFLAGANQSDVRALWGLGEWALRRSMYREANQFFRRSLQLSNRHIGSLLGLANVALLQGVYPQNTNQARHQLERISGELIEEASANEKAMLALLDLIVKARTSRNRSAVLKQLHTQLAKQAGNALAQFLVARELRRYGQPTRALDLIKKAIRLDPGRPDFMLEESQIFLAKGDFESARARALRVGRLDFESGRSLLLVGDAYRGEKNLIKAREYYEKSQKFEDVAALSHLRLGDLFNSQRDRDQAQAEYELAVPLLSRLGERRKAAETAVKLAKIFTEKNRVTEFLSNIQKAMDIDAEYAPPYALMATNLNLEKAEGRSEAKKNCAKYLKLAPRGQYASECRKLLRLMR